MHQTDLLEAHFEKNNKRIKFLETESLFLNHLQNMDDLKTSQTFLKYYGIASIVVFGWFYFSLKKNLY